MSAQADRRVGNDPEACVPGMTYAITKEAIMKKGKALILALLLFSALSFAAAAQEAGLLDGGNVAFDLKAEAGWAKVLHHTYQVGQAGTVFDFVTMGGQEILFPFERFDAGMRLFRNHEVRFLYQPLTIATEVRFKEAVTIDGVTFPAGTPMDIVYGFPFYRLTYAYHFFGNRGPDLAAGAAVQLRNASIRFASQDGTLLSTGQNLGVVPALHLSGSLPLTQALTLGFEATGIYASSAIINGANFSFEGSLLDASLYANYRVGSRFAPYLNVRFVGGSARGTSQYPDLSWAETEDDYTANYLAALSLTLGISVK